MLQLVPGQRSLPHLPSFFSAWLDLQQGDKAQPNAGTKNDKVISIISRTGTQERWVSFMCGHFKATNWLLMDGAGGPGPLWRFLLSSTSVGRPTAAPWWQRRSSSSIPVHTPSQGKCTSHWSSGVWSQRGTEWGKSAEVFRKTTESCHIAVSYSVHARLWPLTSEHYRS